MIFSHWETAILQGKNLTQKAFTLHRLQTLIADEDQMKMQIQEIDLFLILIIFILIINFINIFSSSNIEMVCIVMTLPLTITYIK